MIVCDFLVRNVRQLVNPARDDVVRGRELNSVRLQPRAWLAAEKGIIRFVGSEREFAERCSLRPGAEVIDGSDFIALPGFVDPHTHLPFAGTRQDEFRQKLQGVSYQEIARGGGGIKQTVRLTRAILEDDLLAACMHRLDHMLLQGTTTAEAKSGYGLDRESELKQLQVLQRLRPLHPLEVVPTFMAAHEIPDEFKGCAREYLDFILAEIAPEVRQRELAEFCDIFCEEGYFSFADSDYYLGKMAANGFKIKVHADEFSSNGAATLAVRHDARSAEHLIAISEEEISAIAPSATAAILLPGVSFFLKLGRFAPARRIIAQDGILALGTDFNPGSSMVSSQLFVFHLGIFLLGLTIAEAINAVTVNAAYAIDRQLQAGSLIPGKKMDALLLDIPDYSYLGYHLGIQPVHTVIKSGKVVVRDRRLAYSRGDSAANQM